MKFRAEKSHAAWLGLIFGLIIFAFILWGIDFSLGAEDKTFKLLLYIPVYIFMGLYLLLLIGAFNLQYEADDEGLIIKWSLRKKKISWEDIDEVIEIKGRASIYPFLGASWPGYMVGLYSVGGLGPVRMYASRYNDGFLYIKSQKGFVGITPENDKLRELILSKTDKELQTIDMDEMPVAEKGRNMWEDRFFNLYYKLNIIFLIIFAAYTAIAFPGSGAPSIIILLLVLAIALFFFNAANASRLFQYSNQGAYATLLIGLAVTGVFIILSMSEISF